jgi:RimJ/RimL family protein N-acetyltransferase
MKIVGKCIILRDEPHDSDTDDLYRWCNLEEWNYYDEPDHVFKAISREQFDAWRGSPHSVVPGHQRCEIDNRQGQHLGWVNCYQPDQQAGSIYVGIDLPESDTWGKGYGTEALYLWVDYLFRQTPLQTIHLKTWTGNERMKRIAYKCGFRELSRSPHRADFSIRGEPLEFVEYAVSRSEWEARSLSESGAYSQSLSEP